MNEYLINKILYYRSSDKIKNKLAKSAYNNYHKHMNNKIVANYILSLVDLINKKKPFLAQH